MTDNNKVGNDQRLKAYGGAALSPVTRHLVKQASAPTRARDFAGQPVPSPGQSSEGTPTIDYINRKLERYDQMMANHRHLKIYGTHNKTPKRSPFATA